MIFLFPCDFFKTLDDRIDFSLFFQYVPLSLSKKHTLIFPMTTQKIRWE